MDICIYGYLMFCAKYLVIGFSFPFGIPIISIILKMQNIDNIVHVQCRLDVIGLNEFNKQ